MISREALEQYSAVYPNDDIGYSNPDGLVMITIDGEDYIQPEDELETDFLARLARSKREGKNLFVDEWEREEIDADDDI